MNFYSLKYALRLTAVYYIFSKFHLANIPLKISVSPAFRVPLRTRLYAKLVLCAA